MTEITTNELPRKPEIKNYPVREVGHTFDELFNLYSKFGQATRKSLVADKEALGAVVERSLWGRMEAAKIDKKLKRGQISVEDAGSEKKKIDIIDLQFAKQTNVDIDLPGLGIQSAYYTEVNLPDNLKSPEDISKPPIFLIPALSGDLYGVEPLMKELAHQGRRVVSIAYPESWLGKTTEEFAKAVADNKTYEPHTSYFKEVIKKTIGQEGKLDLWAYSTGCPITAEILSDSDFRNRAENVVLISPVSVVNQSVAEFYLGAGKEGMRLVTMRHGWKTSDVSMVVGAKDKVDKENTVRRKQIFHTLIKNKVIKKMDIWKSIRVNNQGKIILLSAQEDQITKSNKALGEFLKLDQYNVINLKKGSHVSPLTRAEYVVGKIMEVQKSKNADKYTQI